VNQLLEGSADMQQQGKRLQQLHTQIGQELKNIGYIIQQGQIPVSEQQLNLGQKVQEAITEISQV
jgi:virulence-associated protein VapD